MVKWEGSSAENHRDWPPLEAEDEQGRQKKEENQDNVMLWNFREIIAGDVLLTFL